MTTAAMCTLLLAEHLSSCCCKTVLLKVPCTICYRLVVAAWLCHHRCPVQFVTGADCACMTMCRSACWLFPEERVVPWSASCMQAISSAPTTVAQLPTEAAAFSLQGRALPAGPRRGRALPGTPTGLRKGPGLLTGGLVAAVALKPGRRSCLTVLLRFWRS